MKRVDTSKAQELAERLSDTLGDMGVLDVQINALLAQREDAANKYRELYDKLRAVDTTLSFVKQYEPNRYMMLDGSPV